MEPLLITASMSEPVVYYEDGMHLDGILAYAKWLDMTEGERKDLPPITEAWALDFDLPLAKWSVEADTPSYADNRLRDEHGRVWGWLATQALADWSRRSTYELRKRVPIEEMVQWTTAKSMNIGSGPAKAYDLKFPTTFAQEIHWFAIGDRNEIERLLVARIVGIGKHAAKGMGRVAEWRIEPADFDEQFIMARRRVACRESEATVVMSIRPPYSHNSRHTFAKESEI